jgi:prophage tail gpP-like protein
METQNTAKAQAKAQWRSARKRLIETHGRTERVRGHRKQLHQLYLREREAFENYESA